MNQPLKKRLQSNSIIFATKTQNHKESRSPKSWHFFLCEALFLSDLVAFFLINPELKPQIDHQTKNFNEKNASQTKIKIRIKPS
jgi:hypothetical protein